MGDDHGVLDELTWARSERTDCYGGSYMDWKAASAICAGDTSSHDYNQIDSYGSNIWRFDLHFPKRPKALLDPCNSDNKSANWAHPINFMFDISIGWNESPNDLYMSHPAPQDGDSNSQNDEIGQVLNIIGGAGNKYTRIGAAIGEYIINSSDSTDVNRYDNGGEMVFEIGVGGNYYDLPKESDEVEAAQVSVRVNNEYPPGNNHELEYMPEYTFSYAYHDPYTCDCTSFLWTQKTTNPASTGYGVFESI